MTDTTTLIQRIDQEIAAQVARDKAVQAEWTEWARDRESRLRRHETEAKHIIEMLKPRLDAFVKRFKPVVKVAPAVRENDTTVSLTFAATVAKVTLCFELSSDHDVSRTRLECTQNIVPVVIRYDKPSVLEFPLGEVQDDAVVQWFDDRIIAFVRAYVAVVHQDTALREQLKDEFVEDPIARIQFPKYLAASTLERDGQTFYFVDAESRRHFEQQSARDNGRSETMTRL